MSKVSHGGQEVRGASVRHGWVAQGLGEHAGALLVGGGCALTVVLDPLLQGEIAARLGPGHILARTPYLVSGPIVLLAVIGLLGAVGLDQEGRDQVLLFALLATPFLDVVRGAVPIGFLALIAFGMVWASRGLRVGRFDLVRSPAYPLFALVTLVTLLATTSPVGSPVRKFGNVLILVALLLGPALLLMNAVRTKRQVSRCMTYVLWLGVLSGGVALIQSVLYSTTGANYSFAEGEQRFRPTTFGIFLRATAFTMDPNNIAQILSVCSAWLLYFFFAPGAYPWGRKRLLLPGFLVAFAGLLMTFSRGSLVAFLLTSLLVPFCLERRRALWAAAAISVVAVGGVISGLATQVIEGLGQVSGDVAFREGLMRLGIQAMREFPMTGVGPGAFEEFNNSESLAVHNLFLQVGSEMGIPGLIAYVLLLGSYFPRLLLAIRRELNLRHRTILTGLLLGYVDLLIGHLGSPIIGKFFWMYFALLEVAMVATTGERLRHPCIGFADEDATGSKGLAVELRS